MKLWLITDTHLGHAKMVEFCGRPTDHSEIILNNLDKMLAADDVLIHLGDVCIGKDDYWHKELMAHVHCSRKWLIRGNHDRKTTLWYLDHGWDFVGDEIKVNYYGKIVLFSHIPRKYNGDYDYNVHGHFHNSDHRSREPELVAIKNDKQLLLAIENTNLSPVLLDGFIPKDK